MARPSSGAIIGPYRIEKQIGRGGMGVVFHATHLALEKPVALKVISEDLAEDVGFRERFRREPRLAASIDHPNVIPVFDAGEADGQLFVAMRYVDGADLRSLIATEGRLDPPRAARLVAQVGLALDAAHELGLVHRDVKPANVLIEDKRGTEHVYLTDFGLTKGGGASSALTKTGQWVGTPDYVAPEQINGDVVDRRTDIYALGAVLYHAVGGKPPYGDATEVAKIYAHLSKPLPDFPDEVNAPPELVATIQRAMAKSPSDRQDSAGELAREAVIAAGGKGELSHQTAALTIPSEKRRRVRKGAAKPKAPTMGTKASPPTGAGKTTAAGAPQAPATPATSTMESGFLAGHRGRLLAVATVGVIVLGVVGFALGSSGDEGPADPSSFPNTVATGSIDLSFPGNWDRASAIIPIPGTEFAGDQLSLGPEGNEGGAGLSAGQTEAVGPSLLPDGLLSLVGDKAPPSDRVRLGDLDALMYSDLTPDGYDGTLTVFAVPNTAGVATVACTAPAGTPGSVTEECEQIATTLMLVDAESFPVGPDPAYAENLGKAIQTLNTARTARIKDAGDADSQDSQAAALSELAGSYEKAAADLGAATVGPAAQPANAAIVSALVAGKQAHSVMADAADSNDESGYEDGRARASRANSRLSRALAGLSELGYDAS